MQSQDTQPLLSTVGDTSFLNMQDLVLSETVTWALAALNDTLQMIRAVDPQLLKQLSLDLMPTHYCEENEADFAEQLIYAKCFKCGN